MNEEENVLDIKKSIEDELKKEKFSEEVLNKKIEIDDLIQNEIEIDFFKENEPEKIQKEEKKKIKKIDLSKISVIQKNELEKETDLRRALYGNKTVFQIVAAQSGYMAKILPLINKDTVSLLFSNVSRYEYKKGIYKLIWEKIYEFSVGKMDFDTWLKNTTVEDIETFYYGIYCATFPNEGSFRFFCPNCGNQTDYKINNESLIQTSDKEKMKKLISNVTKNSNSMDALEKYSLMKKNENEGIELPDSKLIVKLRTPSLYDSLELLRTVSEKIIDRDTSSATNMLYVDKILIPAKEKGFFNEQIQRESILRIIDNLTISDAQELQTAVLDRVYENRISYSIKSIKCSHCGEESKNIDVSIEDILFTLIFEKTR